MKAIWLRCLWSYYILLTVGQNTHLIWGVYLITACTHSWNTWQFHSNHISKPYLFKLLKMTVHHTIHGMLGAFQHGADYQKVIHYQLPFTKPKHTRSKRTGGAQKCCLDSRVLANGCKMDFNISVTNVVKQKGEECAISRRLGSCFRPCWLKTTESHWRTGQEKHRCVVLQAVNYSLSADTMVNTIIRGPSGSQRCCCFLE